MVIPIKNTQLVREHSPSQFRSSGRPFHFLSSFPLLFSDDCVSFPACPLGFRNWHTFNACLSFLSISFCCFPAGVVVSHLLRLIDSSWLFYGGTQMMAVSYTRCVCVGVGQKLANGGCCKFFNCPFCHSAIIVDAKGFHLSGNPAPTSRIIYKCVFYPTLRFNDDE